jgi:hypothetical protein
MFLGLYIIQKEISSSSSDSLLVLYPPLFIYRRKGNINIYCLHQDCHQYIQLAYLATCLGVTTTERYSDTQTRLIQ